MTRTKPPVKKIKKTVKNTVPNNDMPVKKYTLRHLEKTLTIKANLFCHNYIKHWNITRAAKDAGYSKRTAHVIGHNLLKKVKIQQYIDYIKEDIAKEVGVSKIGLLNILKCHAEAQAVNLFNKDWITRTKLDRIKKKYPGLAMSIKEISTKTMKKVIDHELVEIEYVKVSLYDSQKAISEIMRAMGWYEPEKVDHTIQNTIDISKYTPEEQRLLLNIARKNEYIQQ